MVMPRPKILFSTGCVSQVTNSPTQSSLVMYVDPIEIRGLHPYFAGPSLTGVGTVSDDILADGAYTTVEDFDNTVDVPVIVRKSFGLHSTHSVYRIQPAMSSPEEVKSFPHTMESTYYYWTRLTRKKSGKKKSKKK